MDQRRAGQIVDFLKPSGDVLQIFFGSGDLSKELQKRDLKSYTVVDSKPVDLEKGKAVLSGWKEALPTLSSFDWIFFNDESLAATPNISRPEATKATELLNEGKRMMDQVLHQMPQLQQIHYSDEDLDGLCKNLNPSEKRYLPRFLSQLQQNGQITPQQYKRVADAHGIEAPAPQPVRTQDNTLLDALKACLNGHLKINGCFIAFLPESNYENPDFFEGVITNPSVDYFEERISFDSEEVLVMKVFKRQG